MNYEEDSRNFPLYVRNNLIVRMKSDHNLPSGFKRKPRSPFRVRMSNQLEHVRIIPARENKEDTSPKRTQKKKPRSPKRAKSPKRK